MFHRNVILRNVIEILLPSVNHIPKYYHKTYKYTAIEIVK